MLRWIIMLYLVIDWIIAIWDKHGQVACHICFEIYFYSDHLTIKNFSKFFEHMVTHVVAQYSLLLWRSKS